MANEYLKIAEQVKKFKTVQNLMHYVNKETLYNQHKLQMKKKAVGIDGINKTEYEKDLNENIESLLSRMKSFSYRPLPVRRTYIPKAGSGKLRPLGIPAYEDRLVQGVMADILTTIYEPKFKDFSYGFRPNRSCHDAIKELDKIIMAKKTNFIVDADIKSFFDNVDHEWLIKFLEHDIEDKKFIRYIRRILKSGIIEEGKYLDSDKGTPQGGQSSAILANIYLHYVLDLWFEKEITNKFNGEAFMVRYVDDFVCCFKYESEAKKFYKLLQERMEKFGLKLAEDKSKIICFGRYAREYGSNDSFDFLGFTYINGTSKNGKYIIIHQTSRKKMSVKMAAAKEWLRENMHMNTRELMKKLNTKLIGHYRYYGVTGNSCKINAFSYYVIKEVFKTLNRRSQRKMTWEKFKRFLIYNPIAKPKIYVSLTQCE
jgi:group II intron reverse transcriptase/maturase